MAIFLLSLMVILSAVNGYRQPFTAFHHAGSYAGSRKIHHAQVPTVHGSGHYLGTRRIQPATQRLVLNSGYQKFPSTYQGFQRDSSLVQRQYSNFQQNTFFGGRNAAFSSSGNLVEQVKAQAETTNTVLKSIENNDKATQYIDSVLKSSSCLNSIEDGIKLMDQSAKLVVENGPEIIYLEAIVDSLENEKNITKLIKSSAKILRTLEGLIPILSAKSSNLCISSSADSIEAFRDLAHAFEDLLNQRDINLPQRSRQQLKLSSNILSEVANFIDALNKSIASFDTLCKDDQKNSVAVYTTIADIMESLASLFDVLGFEEKSKDVKKQGEFVKKIVDVFADLDDLDTTLECGLVGSYGGLAQTLEDLAEIVQNVGIETLAKELGIDLNFINTV